LFKSPVHYAIRAWLNIFRIYRDFAPLKFFGIIGGTFFSIGMVLGIFIVGRIFVVGDAGGIPRVILSALMVLTGMQIILFGFLADMYRNND